LRLLAAKRRRFEQQTFSKQTQTDTGDD